MRVSIFERTLTIIVPWVVPKASMAHLSILCCTNVATYVSCNNDYVFSRYSCSLIVTQLLEDNFYLITTACLRWVCQEEVKKLIVGDYDHLHGDRNVVVIETLHLDYQVPKTFKAPTHTVCSLWVVP